MSVRLKTVAVFSAVLLSNPSYAQSIEENDEYVVTASLSPVSKSSIGSALTVITSADLEKRGTTYLPDILRGVPGLAVNRSGSFGTQTDIRVRGAEANHTLVLIDGVEANDPSFGSSFQFAFLTADNIERIEILRGAQSALWGSDAIGAVINIITKKGQGPLEINAGFEGGSFDTQRSVLGGSYGNELFNINLNAEVLRTDGTNIARDGNEDDGHHNRTYDLKLGFTPGEIFDFNYVRRVVKSETQSDPQPFTSTIIVDAEGNQTDIDQVYQKASASVALFDKRWKNTFSFIDTKNRTDFASTVFGASFLNGDKTKYSFQSDLNFTTTALTNINHDLSFLTEYEDDNATGSFIGGTSQVGFITRSYVGEYRFGLFDRLFISTGIRHDDNDFFDDETTYRVTGAYKLKETGTRFHIAYGTGVKNPTISELFGNFPTFTGNPDLTPESSRGWDFGFEQDLFDGKLNFDITYFKNLIADQITGSNQTVTNSNGTNKIQGIEFTSRLSLIENLDLNTAYTYTDSEDANDLELIRRAKHIGNVNLNYSFYESKANLNISANYNGTQIDSVFPPFPTASFRATLDSFTIVNLVGSYKFNKYISLYGKIENLTDESYEEVFGFTSPGIAGYAGINLTLNP